MAKKGGLLRKLFGAAAVAGAATVVSKLEKQAKEEGRDILDVAKDKVDNFVADVKSGEAAKKAKDFANKATDFAEKTAQEVNSGEFTENLKEKINETVDSVKSGEFAEKASDFANKATDFAENVKDGVVDLLDGNNNNLNTMNAEETRKSIFDEAEEVLEDIHKDN